MRHARTRAGFLAALLAFAGAGVAAVPAPPVDRSDDAPAIAEPAFEAIGTRQGLSSYSVFATLVDQHGFVWLAGDNGLHRYDGRDLHTLDRDPSRPDTLASRTNTALAETDDALWILGFNGQLQRLDKGDGRVRAFPLARPDGLTAGRGTSLALDQANRLWIGTDVGLFRLDSDTSAAAFVPLFGGEEPRITALATAEGGNVLHVGTVDGHLLTWLLFEGGNSIEHRPIVMKTPDAAVPLAVLQPPHDSTLYVGTNRGLFRRAGSSTRPHGLEPMGPMELRQGVIDALAFDETNASLWLGGAQQRGLSRLDLLTGRLSTYVHHPDDPHSLPADRVNALSLDAHDNLWIGLERGGAARLRVSQQGVVRHRAGDQRTDSLCAMRPLGGSRVAAILCGEGAVVLDTATGTVEDRQAEIDAALPFPAPSLTGHALAPDGKDGYWLPTNNLGLVHWRPDAGVARRHPLHAADGTPLPDPYMNDAIVDGDGTVWVACSLGLARMRAGEERLTLLSRDSEPGRSLTGGVLSLAIGKDGVLWLGTTQGLLRHDPHSGTTRRHAFAADDPASLSDNLVISVHVAADGTLWVGTQAGLNRAMPGDGGELRFRRYGVADGLPDQTIDAITSTAQGGVWIGTTRGIASLDAARDRFRAFAPGDGVPDSPVNWRAALAAADGSLYFGTNAGLLHVFPDRFLAAPDPPPPLLGSYDVGGVARMNLLGRGVAPFEVGHDRGEARFTVAAFGDTRPLAFRLVGLDPEWHPLPPGLSVGYGPLPPGRYRFEVRHEGRDPAAPAELVVPLRVLPPPWRTPAAYAAYAFLALLVFGWMARSYARKRANEKRHVRELHHLANFDALTGLPNRALFTERLAHAMREGEGPLALIFIDLDRFKNINDSLGHRFGDQVLIAAARRLAGALPKDAGLARLGGDEFTVVLPDLHHEHEAAAVAQALLEAFAAPLRVEGSDVVVTLSLGVSLFPAHTRDPALLVQYADSAMYFAKNAGRNAHKVFQPEMVAQVSRRLALETSLRVALEAGELYPVFQPQVDLASDRLSGAEVLLRWQSAEHGAVAPAEFIPILEDTGLIEPVGLWLVDRVCHHLRTWRESGLAIPSVAVNVSVHQLIRGDLSERLAELLGTLALPKHALEIEVTESALMENAQAMGAALAELRGLGLGLAIDDFGTGYSSFASLSHLPVNKLKIDKVFIDGLGRGDGPTQERAGTLCAAIIAMAHNLRLTVVAEGVETEAQHRELLAMGCDEAQGYWYCRPLPLEEFERFVRERAQKASLA
jgi:diguanylate cyclase (GGDEF)-like protein